ncbi:unnamed protein product [Toxocara canis]|uniref:Amine oxidase n=1 Tax=Toxocara canis TaxID=6265 RepID=A0A183U723_TOXCA|nr:unnamed protein product [Toxocara canis]
MTSSLFPSHQIIKNRELLKMEPKEEALKKIPRDEPRMIEIFAEFRNETTDVWDLMEPVLGSAASKPVEYIELEAPPLGIWLRNYVLGLAKWIGLL